MSYFSIFNEYHQMNLPFILHQDIKVLIKEFKSYDSHYQSIMNKLGLVHPVCSPFINITINNTFVKEDDFLHACMILRPFILEQEQYYSRANNIIRVAFGNKNNILLMNSLDEICPSDLSKIPSVMPCKMKINDTQIVKFLEDLNLNKNSKANKLRSYIKNNYKTENGNTFIIIGGYDFFVLYLNSYVYHRDARVQYFMEDILKIKNLNLSSEKDMIKYLIIQDLYLTTLFLLKKVSALSDFVLLINDHLQNKNTFLLQYFQEEDPHFPNILIHPIS